MSLTTCPRCGWKAVVHDHPPPRASVCLACGWLEMTDEDEVPPAMADGDTYLIWSHEHSMWWGAGGARYVRKLSDAGRYTRAHAIDVCAHAIPGAGQLPELPVRLVDVREMQAQHRAKFPNRAPEPWE